MKNWDEVIRYNTFRYINHTELDTFEGEPYTAMTSFAIDDALATAVSNGNSPPTIRLWSHPQTIVLGIPDARLPYIDEGTRYLKEMGYNVIVRNSGGLAVALDEHVLNLSLIIPEVKQVSIHDAYDAMVRFIEYMFRDLTSSIKAFEIVGSYCPGDYDLSIGGRKFAGISQRRIKEAAAIQIYLDVDGESFKRAEHIQRFYQIAKQGETTKFEYPDVEPSVMGSLADLLGVPLTVDDVMHRVYETLNDFSDEIVVVDFSAEEKATFEKRYLQMVKRNEVVSE
ncbi:lipoate--protein ligase family protein [Oceanobacillus sp. CAU 1775]